MIQHMSSIRTVLVAVEAAPQADGVVVSHGGELLSTDRVLAAFDAPADAVRAAVALIELDAESAIRVGVDAGEPAVAVDVAERICAAAESGQALVTEAVAHLAGRAVADLLRPAGAVRVAELRRTVPVFAAGPAPPDATDTRTTSVVIADDQALLRAGFRIILDAEPDLRVVGEAGDGWAAVDVVRRRHPMSCSWTSACPAWTACAPRRRSWATRS
jgi:hypothetical protein